MTHPPDPGRTHQKQEGSSALTLPLNERKLLRSSLALRHVNFWRRAADAARAGVKN
jgi:hypothetical protein